MQAKHFSSEMKQTDVGGTCCPNCGTRLGHIHLGCKFPLSSTISAQQINCPKCKTGAIVFRYKKQDTKEFEALCDLVDGFIKPDGVSGCALE